MKVRIKETNWLYPGRVVGGHRDHRHAHRIAVAGGAAGPRGGPSSELHKQPEADWLGSAQFPRHLQPSALQPPAGRRRIDRAPLDADVPVAVPGTGQLVHQLQPGIQLVGSQTPARALPAWSIPPIRMDGLPLSRSRSSSARPRRIPPAWTETRTIPIGDRGLWRSPTMARRSASTRLWQARTRPP